MSRPATTSAQGHAGIIRIRAFLHFCARTVSLRIVIEEPEHMFKSIKIVGHGRAGSALHARLRERGLDWRDGNPDLVVLCVPDAAICAVAERIEPGPWIAHVSGATPLAALAPHTRRFGLHPLQTFNRSGLGTQLDGSWAAVTAETAEARTRGFWLAERLGVRPFEIRDEARALYHAGAAIASNYLVTLFRSASRLLESAGAPSEALIPLMRRTIDNGFELTGPIARGDWATVGAHLTAIHEAAPELERMYRALAEVTAP
jgi:predicted short-subunit dehydrogenase-like oxidoreductase (DUF2520 family)